MIEVGPGPGGITRQLFEHGAGRVAAIEKDIRLFPALQVERTGDESTPTQRYLDTSQCGGLSAAFVSRRYSGFQHRICHTGGYRRATEFRGHG